MNPLDLFKSSIGKMVTIHLTDKSIYTGHLLGFDSYVNIILKDVILKSFSGKEENINECMVNGQTVTFIEII